MATRDVSPDLGLVDGDGNVDASSQLNGILSVAALEDEAECDGARMAVGISGYGLSYGVGYGLSYGVGSDPHQAALANPTGTAGAPSCASLPATAPST